VRCPFFWIDAFTDRVFRGNPAGVCSLTEWPRDELLQKIAWQNGLAETAFFVRTGEARYHLRWFTPEVEMDLCGHATLASAHVLLRELGLAAPTVTFDTRSGALVVSRADGGRLSLDFPSRPPLTLAEADWPQALLDGLGACRPLAVGQARDLLCLLPDAAAVQTLRPDFNALQHVDTLGIIITAPGDDCDFVSRFFAPRAGVPEDPVTGSAHCTLIPYWAERLGRTRLQARQVSARGGELWCELAGDRVHIAGHAVTYLKGELSTG
jgi:PhzF family phenazine biosynthesis protein